MTRFLAILPLAAMLLQCKGEPPASSAREHRVERPSPAGTTRGAGLTVMPLIEVKSGTWGPITLVMKHHVLAAWADPAGEGHLWRSVALNPDGRKIAKVNTLGNAAGEVELGTLGLAQRGRRAVLAYTVVSTDGACHLMAQTLDVEGHSVAEPTEVGSSSEDILWMQVLDAASGPLIVWANSRGDRADIRAAGLDADGRLRSAARDVVTDVRAWQVADTPNGASLAVVRASSSSDTGPVALLLLDDNGDAVGAPIEVSREPTAQFDLDLVRVKRRVVLAWSDRRALDARLTVAAVDAAGKIVTPPTPATPASGEQAVLKLIPGREAGPATLVWENLTVADPPRTITISPIDDAGHLASQRAKIRVAAESNSLPEMVMTPEGLAMLLLVDDSSSSGTTTPTFLQLDNSYRPVSMIPLRLASPSPPVPDLAWSLDCRTVCRALVAWGNGSPTIGSVSLEATEEAARRAANNGIVLPSDDSTRPRLREVHTLTQPPPLSAFDVSSSSHGVLLAWLTYFDPTTPIVKLKKPGPDGRTDPPRADLELLALGSDSPPGNSRSISIRARSLGGVALAPANGASDTLVVWSALDAKQPQVFLTRVGPDGHKIAQRMLTHSRGEITDVAATAVDQGWCVGWVDSRHGNPELYAVGIGRTLNPRGAQQRLTETGSSATGLRLLRRKDAVWAIWAEATDPRRPGRSELYLRKLALSDAHPLSSAERLVQSSMSAHSPELAGFGDGGAVVAWIESEPRAETVETSARVRLARLDDEGRIAGTPAEVAVSGGSPLAVGVDCDRTKCHGAVTVDVGARGELRAFVFDPTSGTVSRPRALLRGTGPADQAIYPVVAGDQIFSLDRIGSEKTKILQTKVDW